jgi:hypothetical protein
MTIENFLLKIPATVFIPQSEQHIGHGMTSRCLDHWWRFKPEPHDTDIPGYRAPQSPEQMTIVTDGKPVLGLPREIQEVRNAVATYGAMSNWTE